MYGTDWHMKEMVNEVDDYFDYIVGMFSRQPLAEYAERFFFKNAQAYLNLNAFPYIESGGMA